MLVLDPIPVIIDDLPEDHLEEIELPFDPKNPDMGNHTVPFTRTVYIDRSDFREVDSKDYFRLAPGKAVGLLKVPYPIKATTYEKDESTGLITAVHATYEKPAEGTAFKKPKTYIQWVAESTKHNSPIKAEVRIFSSLFKSENPDSAEGGFMNDVNPKSEEIYPNAVIEVGLNEVIKRAPWPREEGEKKLAEEAAKPRDTKENVPETVEAPHAAHQLEANELADVLASAKPTVAHPETVRFQALRVGYFAMDSDSRDGKIVLNRIVSLKEDSGKA
jgi:glutaminyl-tRNA synthetase